MWALVARCAAAAALAAGCAGEVEVIPREGAWQGVEVGFHVEAGEVSGWHLQRLYCEGVLADGVTACVGHPWSYYDQAVPIAASGVDVALDALTLEARFVAADRAEGTWRVTAPGCCTASGAWAAVHVRDLPPAPLPEEPDPRDPDDPVQPEDPRTDPPRVTDDRDLMASAASMCARFNADRASAEPSWSGDLASCQAGDLDEAGRSRVISRVNLYRNMAGLPGVGHDASFDAQAQGCSLLMDANLALSHFPPEDWACWEPVGAEAASHSNLATTPALWAIDLYMVDGGNADTLGHRRWLLGHGTGPFGVGSTAEYSCLHVMGSTANHDLAWSAWPPPGYFPIQAASDGWWSIDEMGWSVHGYLMSLTGATAQVSRGGQRLAVTTELLPAGYGDAQALAIRPDGWVMEAGASYTVAVSGVSSPITYSFDVVDCDGYR